MRMTAGGYQASTQASRFVVRFSWKIPPAESWMVISQKVVEKNGEIRE